ncbi:MAG: MFS transporter [Deltaproteobacteria bacterium]|jgi:MFS family permease|nr:MFS transporter [Deltaproteobacteria bacterium]
MSSPPQARNSTSGGSSWRFVPGTVWTLGFVSLSMDISSEMIHAYLPVFLVSTLGASATLVGVIEGIAEGTASITRVFSGAISDAVGRRKRLAALGYGLSALTKPLFALALTPFEVLAGRFVDRMGKGIRGAPRDALIADVTPPAVRGAAYGLRQALDTLGAFAGPLLGMGLLVLLGGNLRLLFALATIPGLLAVALLVLGVEESGRAGASKSAPPRLRARELRAFARPFWGVVAVGAVFTLARFSEAFIVLRAQEVGLPLALIPLVMIAMNLVYALVSTPAGALSDRIDRRLVLAGGLVALITADLVLALFASAAGVLVGAGLWGLHLGLSQGLLAALVADAAPERLRGTAFGLFHLVSGVSLFAASLLAGALWQGLGSAATFEAGALLSSLALIGLLWVIRRDPSAEGDAPA